VNQLDDWVTANADDPDFEKKLNFQWQYLMRPYVEEVALKRWNWFNLGGTMFHGKESETEQLVDKRYKQLQEQPIWNTLTESQRKKARIGFGKGGTVEGFLDALGDSNE
jgi:hypothetical protein